SACTRTPENLASRYVKAVPVDAQHQASIEVSASDSPELAGAALQVSSGALTRATTLTLDLDPAGIIQAPDLAAGPAAVWGPSGTTFEAEVTMTLPLTLPEGATSDDLYVSVLEEDGSRFEIDQGLNVDDGRRTVSFRVNGFSKFQPGAKQCGP